MKNIDFLPDQYRKQDADRKTRMWRFAGAIVITGVLGVVALLQFSLRNRVQSQLIAIAPQYKVAQSQAAQLATLQEELRIAEQDANLYTYLRHPWPRTQIIAAITSPLSNEMALTELQITQEEIGSQRQGILGALEVGPGGQKLDLKSQKEALAKMTPPERDLYQLRKKCEAQQTVVNIAGTTTDTAMLRQYLARVGKSPLFVTVELCSVESASGPSEPNLSEFHIQFVVAPGYGQLNGPKPPRCTLVQTKKSKHGRYRP